jgi:hypothetical protein
VTQNMMRSIRGFGSINMMIPRGFFTSHTLQIMLNRRFAHGMQFRVSDTIMLKRFGDAGARIQHASDGSWSYRSDQDQANDLFTNYIPTRHTFKGDFVYSIPALKNIGSGSANQVLKAVTSDWQLSGIWSANTASAYTVGYSFQNGAGNQQITGSPDFGGRITVKSNPGGGCNTSDIYRQFSVSAFAPPAVGSVGLESGNDYMRGCFYQQFDLALQREFRVARLGEGRRLSFRIDAFNAFNQSHITGRNGTMTVTNLTDSTIVNLPYDASGNLIPTRSTPRSSGFGMATNFQGARTIQLWLRVTF